MSVLIKGGRIITAADRAASASRTILLRFAFMVRLNLLYGFDGAPPVIIRPISSCVARAGSTSPTMRPW